MHQVTKDLRHIRNLIYKPTAPSHTTHASELSRDLDFVYYLDLLMIIVS